MQIINSLSDKAVDEGPSVFYQASFRDVIEMHLPLIRQSQKTTTRSVEPIVAYKNENDFTGLLNDLGYPLYLHWTIMRINGLFSPTEYQSDLIEIIIPSIEYLDQLRRMHTTIHQIR